MSADRYEIQINQGGRLEISIGGSVVSVSTPESHTFRAIRQQARDIAALKDALADEMTANEAFRKAGGAHDDEDMPTFCARLIAESEIGRQWNADSSLAKWSPLTAERVSQDAQEIAKLRADLAAAVAERDHQVTIAARAVQLAKQVTNDAFDAIAERDQLRARLAAIDAAPAIAHIANKIGPDYFPCGLTILADRKLPPLGTDLIARPAKD